VWDVVVRMRFMKDRSTRAENVVATILSEIEFMGDKGWFKIRMCGEIVRTIIERNYNMRAPV
jgi:hypothetical protein